MWDSSAESEHDSDDVPFLQFLTGPLSRFGRRDSCFHNHKNSVAEIGKNIRVGNRKARRRIDKNPIKNRGHAIQQRFQSPV